MREEERREKVALLAFTDGNDALIVGLAFRAIVEAAVVVVAVVVILAVRLVVLVVVGDDVVEGEAVVGGEEIDARPGPAAAMIIDVA